MSVYYDKTTMTNAMHLIVDPPIREQQDRKQKKNRSKAKSTEQTSKRVVMVEYGPSKCNENDGLASYQLSNEEIDSPELGSVEFQRQDTSAAITCAEHSIDDYKLPTDSHADNRKAAVCSKDSNISKQETEEISTNSFAGCLLDGLACRHFSDPKSCETIKYSSKFNDCSGGGTNFESQHCHSQSYAFNSLQNPSSWRGNKHSNFFWRKSWSNVREKQIYGPRKSNYNNMKEDVSLEEKNFPAKQKSFSGEGLLPAAIRSTSGHGNGIQVVKKEENLEPHMHRAFQSRFGHFSCWVAQHRSNESYCQICQQSKVAARQAEELRLKSHDQLVGRNNCNGKNGLSGYGENFLRIHSRSFFSQRGSFQESHELHHYRSGYAAVRTIYGDHTVVTHGSQCSRPSSAPAQLQQCTTRWRVVGQFQPYGQMEFPRMIRVSDRSFNASADREPYSGLNVHNKYKLSHDNSCRTKAVMWVPVATKGSNCATGVKDSTNIPKLSCNEVSDSQPKENTVPFCESTSSTSSKGSSVVSNCKVSAVESEASGSGSSFVAGWHVEGAKQYTACNEKWRDSAEPHCAPQGIQIAMFYPLAEIERFLYSAAPVITLSSLYKEHSVFFDDQLPSSFPFKHQTPDISLCSLWNWYEEPGSYGLEVKAEEHRRLKGVLTKLISFCAYFVPSLSALQLFGYTDPSSSIPLDTVSVDQSPMEDKKAVNFNFVDSELVFEFFESEQPHLRRPLHIKITELITAETSNLQLYGDPSKLESLSLHDLHPASWFSVAWYPIYRIPEATFRASFLTYHSLSHVLGKYPMTNSLDKMSHITFPVIGLQSYNTQGECWFDLRIPVDFSLKESIASEILRKRLWALEENALLLSRGCVTKDDVKVVNQHPDYEFFVSRKH